MDPRRWQTIKAILDQKGLSLGQGLEDREKEEKRELEEIEKDVDPEILSRPIESLNLSIRSRRWFFLNAFRRKSMAAQRTVR